MMGLNVCPQMKAKVIKWKLRHVFRLQPLMNILKHLIQGLPLSPNDDPIIENHFW